MIITLEKKGRNLDWRRGKKKKKITPGFIAAVSKPDLPHAFPLAGPDLTWYHGIGSNLGPMFYNV